MGSSIVVQRRVVCQSQPGALWCIITDTEQLNRAIGGGAISLEPNDDDSAARYLVQTVAGGFRLEYEERPFEWLENERFSVHRKVRKGMARTITNSFELSPHPSGGTELVVRIEVEPKYPILGAVMRLQVTRFANRIADQFKRIDENIHSEHEGRFRQPSASVNRDALNRAAKTLYERVAEHQLPSAKRLVEAVANEPDVVVDRIRPLELAEQWGVEGRPLLAACLHAVVAGLLDMSWDIVCPSCATAADRLDSLDTLSDEGHCQLCDISFELELDRAVEATFRPVRALRQVDNGPYCVGGPARTPHVVMQSILPARGTVELRAPAVAGSYRLFLRGGTSMPIRVRDTGDNEMAISAPETPCELDSVTLAPGAAITVQQPTARELHVKIERTGWRANAATAHLVSTMPEFRRMFSHEVLRAGRSFRVGRAVLLFTDLTASTALYRRLGDARAFAVVQDHFELLESIVSQRDGAIVKTMGDAIMAAFMEERTAIDAAIAMHESFAHFRAEHQEASNCHLKIGGYAGPCYCITANDILDYFGQTVNVAARLQGAAKAGELILTAELAKQAQNEGWLRGRALGEHFDSPLKGVGVLSLVRVPVELEGDAS